MLILAAGTATGAGFHPSLGARNAAGARGAKSGDAYRTTNREDILESTLTTLAFSYPYKSASAARLSASASASATSLRFPSRSERLRPAKTPGPLSPH